MTEIDHEKIARESLERIRKHHEGVSSYGCVSLDGTVFTKSNYGCHAMCQSEMHSHKAHIMFSVTGNSDPGVNQPSLEERSMYFSWLCSEGSPFAAVLHNKYNLDSVYVAEYGVLIDNLSAPRNLMVAALAATRACYEHPVHVRMFARLVNSGVYPKFAFFLAGMATVDSSGRVYYGMRSNTNHWPLWPLNANEEYVLNFLRGTHNDDTPFNNYDGKLKHSVGGAWFPKGCLPAGSENGKYLSYFKERASSTLDKSGFSPLYYSKFENFLEVALKEQERLYAISA